MDKNTSYTDEHLVRLAQQGNKQAYTKLLQRYHQRICQIIQFCTHDSANVNDLAQEVAIKVFRYLHYFKKESRFSTWLYRIVRNTIKNHFRTINQQLESEAQFVQEQTVPLCRSPEYDLINMEFNARLESAIARLSEELRLCYGMYLFDGQTYENIAKQMHCPIGTVRSRIFRARKLMVGFVAKDI